MPLEKFQIYFLVFSQPLNSSYLEGKCEGHKKVYNSQYCGLIILLPSFTTYYVSSCDKSCEFFCVLNIFLFGSLLINYLLTSSLMALFSPINICLHCFFSLLLIKLYSPLVFSNFVFYFSSILQSTMVKKKFNVFVM